MTLSKTFICLTNTDEEKMIRKLMILLMLTICNTVFAQSMDSSVCLIAVDEPLKKTGGNQVNTCDPKIIQNMIYNFLIYNNNYYKLIFLNFNKITVYNLLCID